MKVNFNKQSFVFLALLCAFFLALVFPMLQSRTSKENVAERQAQNAGMIRMYCRYDGYSPVLSPNIPFGKRPFNIEFSVFEWAQGRLSRAIDGPQCDSVEVVGRATGVVFSLLSIVVIFFLAAHFAGPLAGAVAATALVGDFLWVKFSSFILVENRMLFCALLAMYCMVKRKRPILRVTLGAVLWFLTLTQKPQGFAFIAPFYVLLEWVLFKIRFEPEKKFFSGRRLQAIASMSIALVLGAIYFAWSGRVNTQGDLPWLVWTGPTVMKWFFGSWAERFELDFYRAIFFDWLKKPGLNFAFATLVILYVADGSKEARAQLKTVAKKVVLFSLPFALGRFAQMFVFLNVYKVHDYYALPGNVLAILTKGILAGLVLQHIFNRVKKVPWPTWRRPVVFYQLAAAILLVSILVQSFLNIKKFKHFSTLARTEGSETYQNEFDLKLFPKDVRFVVVAHLSRGRDYMYLYLSKREGHIWCSWNKKFAPRAFWKREGVQYVAWQEGFDQKQKRAQFIVRTLEEELTLARKNGWSSDVNDVWAGKSMAEWAAIASAKFLDPCLPNQADPRRW